MSTRVLAVVSRGGEASALAGMAALAAVARAERARVRLAYFRRMPSPRENRHGRIIADCDDEMARIASGAVESLNAAARVFDDVPMETVVRFGAPAREVGLEAEAYAPDVVAFFVAPAPIGALRAWGLRRRLARRDGVRIVMLESSRSRSAPSPDMADVLLLWPNVY